jgi:Cupin-like domain
VNAAPSVIAYENVTRARFQTEIQPHGRPAILRGLVSDWPAVQHGQISDGDLSAYLKTFSREQDIQSFRAAPDVNGRFFYTDDLRGFNFSRETTRLSDLLDELLGLRGAARPPGLYAGAVNIAEHMPAFAPLHDLNILSAGTEVLASIWLGNRTRVPPHWDLPQNIACVAAGRRRFTLFPISQIGNLYIGPLDNTLAGQPCSLVDLAAPDLQRFPRFAEAAKHAEIAELEPGDALYIPSLWVHGVESLEPFGMLVNFWWRDGPAHLVTPTLTLMHALLTLQDMPAREREGWRAVFDHFVFNADADTLAHIPIDARGVLGPKSPEALRSLKDFLIGHLKR